MDESAIQEDVAAFADNDEDVLIDARGTLIYVVQGREEEVRLRPTADGLRVEMDDTTTVSYSTFLGRHLGRLDILAERLLQRKERDPFFVDGPASLEDSESHGELGSSLNLLSDQCSDPPAFATRLTFITADGGHGKSVLLREYMHRNANSFLRGTSPYLFWHVDLQGRQLLRLSEALMGDLGDLRVAGLWMSGILALMRHRLLVLAVDGFDELAAEQGSNDAFGALSTLIHQLDGGGSLVAASRRAFFDSDRFAHRSGLLTRNMATACEFSELHLHPWGPSHALEFLTAVEFEGSGFSDPSVAYDDLRSELGGADHPMLQRPFLLSQVAKGMLMTDLSAHRFLNGRNDPLKGVQNVVEAFVEREVTQKWKVRETGLPYLSDEQHMAILGDVAEEMHRAGTDRIPLDIIETLASVRVDDWGIDRTLHPAIIDMMRVHVLLHSSDGGRTRSFDHPEFQSFFLAVALKDHLLNAARGESIRPLRNHLRIDQISESTASYVASLAELSKEDTLQLIDSLSAIIRGQTRPTLIESNIGTLLPALIDGLSLGNKEIECPALFSSLAFAGKHLRAVALRHANFVNVRLERATWHDVTLSDCNLGELTILAECILESVSMVNCHIDGLIVVDHDGQEKRAYSPEHMVSLLHQQGIQWVDKEGTARVDEEEPHEDSRALKDAHKLLRHFHRSTILSSMDIERKYGNLDHLDSVLSLLEDNELLIPQRWRGKGSGRLWRMATSVEDLLKAEDGKGLPSQVAFWAGVRALG
ncbi:hypothetical protein [Euzebya pacifica]|nr:hypothetical protein [Euzebya pacifica]